jgi:hypothetical protein
VPEDIEVPYVERFRINADALLPSVSKIFKTKKKALDTKASGIRNSKYVASDATRSSDEDGTTASEPVSESHSPVLPRRPNHDDRKSSGSKLKAVSEPHPFGLPRRHSRDDQKSHDWKVRRKNNKKKVIRPPMPAAVLPDPIKPKEIKRLARLEIKDADDDYRPKGATIDLEPIPENKTLRLPRASRQSRPNMEDMADHDPNNPLVTWYFPRRSPDYWELLDDVSKMFSDLHIQDVTLKHFQRPIDYVTVLLCLSNVVFAEMYETLQEKVTDTQYRIEFAVNGRTGVNLYLSAYSREHIYIAKSLLHKVNFYLDLARKDCPRSISGYVHIIESHERMLVTDKRKSWGRVPDGQFRTFTDIDSPTVVHEIGIAESRAELYRRAKRYLQEVRSVNLVVAIKVENTECEWADLLVLARDPGNDRICKIFNWVRFWGEGAVNRGDLRYYPSDFLEVEDRWKIPKIHMRPLDILDGPR